jgi:hypothetical protein
MQIHVKYWTCFQRIRFGNPTRRLALHYLNRHSLTGEHICKTLKLNYIKRKNSQNHSRYERKSVHPQLVGCHLGRFERQLGQFVRQFDPNRFRSFVISKNQQEMSADIPMHDWDLRARDESSGVGQIQNLPWRREIST